MFKRINKEKYLKVIRNSFLLFLRMKSEFPIKLLHVSINNKAFACSGLKVENIVAKELTSIKPTTAAKIWEAKIPSCLVMMFAIKNRKEKRRI